MRKTVSAVILAGVMSLMWIAGGEAQVRKSSADLVLVNGIFVSPSQRAETQVSDGDTIAAWPPVAGG